MSQPVYLVRHGQSEWNVRRLTQGQTHHPRLTDLGRDQAATAAELIAADLAGGRVGRLVTSDLARAAQTAVLIGERLDVEPEVDPRLREQSFGELEGQGYDVARVALAAHDWSDPAAPMVGGESLLEVHHRMSAVLGEHDGRSATVLVSHGDTIRTVLALPRSGPHEPGWLEVGNGAVARVDAGGGVSWLG